MPFEWDAGKAKANKAKHGVDLALGAAFDFANAVIAVDDSEDYGEERLVATGIIGQSVYVMVYVERLKRSASPRCARRRRRRS